MTSPAISYESQAERVELTILGKRNSLERFSAPGSHRWPDAELDQLRKAIMELEAVLDTVRGKAGEQRGTI